MNINRSNSLSFCDNDTEKFRKSSVTDRTETHSTSDKNQKAELSTINSNAFCTGKNSVRELSVVPPSMVAVRCAAYPGLQDMPDDLLLNIFSRLNLRDIAVIKNTFQAADRVVNDLLSTESKRWFSRFSPRQQAKFNRIAKGSTDEQVLRTWLGQFTEDEKVVKLLLENRHQRHFPKLLFYTVSRLMADCQAFKIKQVVSFVHIGHLIQIDFSDDGNHMLTLCFSGLCKIYALSPDGNWVQKTTLGKKLDSAKFTGNGKHVVTESFDGQYKIHGLDSDGNWIVESKLPQGEGINFVKFSPDALRVAIIVNTSTLKIFGRGTDGAWAEEYKFSNSNRISCSSLPFNRDGNELMVDENFGSRLYCRGLDGRWEKKTFHVGEPNFFGQFSPNGSHMTILHHSGMEKTAKIFGRGTNGNWIEQAEIHHAGWITSAQFSANSRYVVTSSLDKTHAIYYFATNGSWIKKAIIDSQTRIKATLSLDGRYLAIYPHDDTVTLYALGADGQCTEKINIDCAEYAFFSPDGNHIFTCYRDLVRFYGLGQDGKLVLKAAFEHGQPMRSFTISPTGRYLLTSGYNGKSKLWLLLAENEPGSQERPREQRKAGEEKKEKSVKNDD